MAVAAVAGLGVALGVVLAGSSSTKTRTETFASRVSGPTHTITRVRTVERVLTKVKTNAAPRPAVPIGGVPREDPAQGPHRPQQFSGTGLRVLGTITVPQTGATLR